jgi:hypothetical protein
MPGRPARLLLTLKQTVPSVRAGAVRRDDPLAGLEAGEGNGCTGPPGTRHRLRQRLRVKEISYRRLQSGSRTLVG